MVGLPDGLEIEKHLRGKIHVTAGLLPAFQEIGIRYGGCDKLRIEPFGEHSGARGERLRHKLSKHLPEDSGLCDHSIQQLGTHALLIKGSSRF